MNKLYKNDLGYWLNDTLTPSNIHSLRVNGESVAIINLNTEREIYNGLVTSILDKNSNNYPNVQTFLNLVGGFFVNNEIDRLANVANQTLVSLKALSYSPQSLTKEQQAQARENINAQDSNATVYLSEDAYQILLENDLVLPDVEYNIYE